MKAAIFSLRITLFIGFIVAGFMQSKAQSLAADFDNSFVQEGTGLSGIVNALAVQPDGKLVVGGQFSAYDLFDRKRIARLNEDGTLDPTFDPGLGFGPGAGAVDYVTDLLVQPDGKILVLGTFTEYNGQPAPHIIRLLSDGTIDPGFNPGTGFPDGGKYNSIALQDNGQILVGGTFDDYNDQNPTGNENLYRLNSDGSFDLSFVGGPDITFSGSEVYEVVVLDDFSVLVSVRVGCCQWWVQKMLPDGSLDASFPGTTFDFDAPFALAVQQDGKILVGGNFGSIDGNSATNIARLNANGSFDDTFDPGFGANGAVKAIIVQPDGKLIVGGAFDFFNDQPSSRIVRLRANGNIDPTFTVGPGFESSGNVNDLAFSDQFGIYAAGSFLSYQGNNVSRVVKLKNFIIIVNSVTPSDQVCIGSDVTVDFTIYPTTGFDAGNNFYLWAGTDIVNPENYFFGYTAQTAAPQTFQIPVDATPGDMFFLVSSDGPNVLIDQGSVYGPVTLIEPTESLVDIDFDDSGTCLGSELEFTALPVYGGSAPEYDWFVNGISQGINTDVFVTNQLSDGDEVWVTMTSNALCPAEPTVQAPTIDIALAPSESEITVTALLNGQPMEGMELFIYNTHNGPDNLTFTGFWSEPTNSSGQITFAGVWPGNYMFKAQPTENQVLQDNILRTWYPQSIGWVWAQEVTVGCNTVVNDLIINLLNPQVVNPVPVTVGGFVRYGQGRSFEGDPIPGVPIIIMNDTLNSEMNPINNLPLLTRFTEVGGTYSFDQLPVGDYKIYLDLPGLPIVATHFFTISSGQTEFPNLDFCVDTTSGIWTGCQIEDFIGEVDRGSINVFPNPFDNFTEIMMPDGSDARQLNRAIYTSSGSLIRPRTEMVGSSRIRWDMGDAPTGLYHFIIWNDAVRYSGKMIKE